MSSTRLQMLAVVLGVALATWCGGLKSALAQPSLGMDAGQQKMPVSEYHLGTGDHVRIIVYGEDKLSGEFSVSSAGKIEFPLIGSLDVGGLTPAQLQALIAGKLSSGYLLDPRVSAEVLTYRPFYILGEVNKPGEYPCPGGLTIDKAVATAQGYTYRANKKRVFLKRANESEEHEYPADSGILVQPGDTIRISERYF